MMSIVQRFNNNPLFTPADIPPSNPGLEVMCVFNPGATWFEGRRLLLLRVAERPIPEDGYVSTVTVDPDSGETKVRKFRVDDPDVDQSDPRMFSYKGENFLTSLSHLRIATSKDGVHFDVEATPAIYPTGHYETFGIEDARITRLDGQYYINYSACSPRSVATALCRTSDFKTYERLGLIFGPDNKDIAFFPEQINGRYHTLHRPSVKHCGEPSIWQASSSDLLDWGRHEYVAGPRIGRWDSQRVGAGSSPIKTDEGWLALYHGANHNTRYCIGAMLLDLQEPWRVLSRPDEPFFVPEADCEVSGGLMPNVVFHNGTIECDGTLELYYGAGDLVTCGARVKICDLMNYLKKGSIPALGEY